MPVWQQTVHALRMMACLLKIDYQLISVSRNPCQSLSCLFVSHSPTKNPSSKNDYLSLRRRRLCGLASSTKSSQLADHHLLLNTNYTVHQTPLTYLVEQFLHLGSLKRRQSRLCRQLSFDDNCRVTPDRPTDDCGKCIW